MRRNAFSRLALAWLTVGLVAGGCSSEGGGGGDHPTSAPTISSFEVSPDSIRPGEPVTLSWATTGATSVSITDDHGSTVGTEGQLSGSIVLEPPVTTTWTLVARNDAGQVSDTARVAVDDLVEPRITFSASPDQIVPGGRSTLTWAVTDASRVVLRKGEEILEESETTFSGSREVTPIQTTTYVLEASGPGGSASREVTVTMTGNPVIRSFTSTPQVIRAGTTETVQLAWKIDGQLLSLELLLPENPERETVNLPLVAEGTHEVTISETSTFTLVAMNDVGTTMTSVTVEALDAPMISRFTSNAALVGANDPFTITWSTGNATSVVLERNGSVVAENLDAAGSMEQSLTGPATYTLRATNPIGIDTSEVSVEVGPPLIESFDPSLSQGAPGADITFTWTTVAATSVRVVTDEGEEICAASDPSELAAGSCKGAVPEVTAGFRLVATNGSGPTTSDLSPFLIESGPVIRTFRITPVTVSVGGEVTIRWEVTRDATGAIPALVLEDGDGNAIDLGDADPLDGSIKRTFGAAGTYSFTLTATTPGMEPAVATRSVQVVEEPAISSFTATPPTFDPSNPSVVLAWQSTGGVSAEIHVLAGGSTVGNPLFSSTNAAIVANGSHTAHPFAPTSYRLTVRNTAGDSATADVEVQSFSGIADFSTSASLPVARGSTVTLNWDTGGGRVYLKGMVEVPTTNAPFVDISSSGTLLQTDGCNSAYPFDEGCADFGLSFPFLGQQRDIGRVYVNGFVSFDMNQEVALTYVAEPIPSTSKPFAHLAPYWSDLFAYTDLDMAVYGERRDQDSNPHAIIMWSHVVIPDIWFEWADMDLNFEVVAFQSGAFEFRYGIMWADWIFQPYADGEDASIGYQNFAGTAGYMLNPGMIAVPGGLSNRSFRAELNAPSVGSMDVVVRGTTTYELCVDTGDVEDICEQLTVTTN